MYNDCTNHRYCQCTMVVHIFLLYLLCHHENHECTMVVQIIGTVSVQWLYISFFYICSLIVFEVCQDGQAMLLHHNLQQSRQLPYRLTTFQTITTISKGNHQPGSRGMCFSSHQALWLLRWSPPQYGNNSSSCFPDLSFQSV